MHVESPHQYNQRKQEILEKAKTLGYRVKQTEQNGQIRMVLVRTA